MRYPLRDPQWFLKLLLGGLAMLLGSFVLPLIFAYGYQLGVLRRSIEAPQDETLPEWSEGFEKLMLDGLLGYLATLALQLVAGLALVPGILLLTIGLLVAFAGDGPPPLWSVLLTWPGGVLLLIGAGLLLPATWFIYVLEAQYVAEGNLNALFNLRQVLAAVRANFPDFARSLGYYIAFNLLLGLVMTLLVCSIVGMLLLPFLSFYSLLVDSRLVGLAYHGAREALRPINVAGGSSAT
jgi:hypothetical protein